MIGAKFRQFRFGMRRPRATVGYPLAPRPAEPNFRGRVVVDTDRCIGCGGCADVCPARCIRITDLSPTRRVIRRYLDRCLHCGRCAAVCVYEAVRLEPEYELATPDRSDLFVEQVLFMAACDRCGRCHTPAHPLDRLAVIGMRDDEPELHAAGVEAPWTR